MSHSVSQPPPQQNAIARDEFKQQLDNTQAEISKVEAEIKDWDKKEEQYKADNRLPYWEKKAESLLALKKQLEDRKDRLLAALVPASFNPQASHASVSIRVSRVILVHRWDDNMMHTVRAPDSYLAMRTEITKAFQLTPNQADIFWLYYLLDPSLPLQTRMKVIDQSTYEEFLQRYPVANQLILYVRESPTIPSPQKEPVFLRINTTHDPPKQPDSATLSPFTSPKDSEGRRMHVKKQCIVRDGDGIDGKDIHCVFCRKHQIVEYPKGLSSPSYNGEVAHIVSFKKGDREDMPVPDCLKIFANGSGGKDGVDVVQNVIYLCRECHKYFGRGQIWCEVPATSSPPTYLILHVESQAVQEDHGKLLATEHSTISIPIDPVKRSLFPIDLYGDIWRWNREWAEKRRKSIAESNVDGLTQQLEDVALRVSVPVVCAKCETTAPTKSCKNDKGPLCPKCCKNHGGCKLKTHMIIRDI